MDRAIGYCGIGATVIWLVTWLIPGEAAHIAPTLTRVATPLAPGLTIGLFLFASFQAWKEERAKTDELEDDAYLTLVEHPKITLEYADGRFQLSFLCHNPGTTSIDIGSISVIPYFSRVRQLEWGHQIGYLAPKQNHQIEIVIVPPSGITTLVEFDRRGFNLTCEVLFKYRKAKSGRCYQKKELVVCPSASQKELRVFSREAPEQIPSL